MKTISFSILAICCTIAAAKPKRIFFSNSFHFKPVLTASPSFATLTTVSNWSTIFIGAPTCNQTALNYVCTISPDQSANITTTADLVNVIRANGGIPVTGSYVIVKQAFQRH